MLRSSLKWLGLVAVFVLPWVEVGHAGTFTANSIPELDALMLRLRATQFLQHATFGPKDAEIDALANRMAQIGGIQAAEEWINAQFNTFPTFHEAMIYSMAAADGYSLIDTNVNPTRYRYHSWWHNSLTAPDQLRQRVGWALAQIFVVNDLLDNFNNIANDKTNQPSWMGVVNYHDMLLTNAFGNYRTLLGDVTFHPVMGIYLSSFRNNKPTATTSPDENYAREIQQLFSIGLYMLNQDGTYIRDNNGDLIPTYDNTMIQTFARLFTGMTYAQSGSFTSGTENFHQPMMLFENSHDKDAKVVHGGVTLPANTAALADINAGLNNLFSHPNVGPFICRQLIQRMVRSNPSRGYLSRVVAVFNNNGYGVRGDMKSVIKQILLDQEAWDGIEMVRLANPFRLVVTGQGAERSRLQEPVLQYAYFLRRYARSNYRVTPVGHGNAGRFMLPSIDGNWWQGPYKQPTVFNFYSPDFQPSGEIANFAPSPNIPNGEIVAPEFELLNSVTGNVGPNRYRADIVSNIDTVNNTSSVSYTIANVNATAVVMPLIFSYPTEMALAANGAALVDHLDRTLCCGTMSDTHRAALAAAINFEPGGTDAQKLARVQGALMAVLNCPAFCVME